MKTTQPHAAFARTMDQLDVVAIDDSKSMQSIVRSMLNSLKVGRVRTYDGPQDALDSIHVDPPHLIIVDWLMDPIDGLSMLKALRARRMGPIATIPAIILTNQPTLWLVQAALKAGAHMVLAKPISPMTLQKRIKAILTDKRLFSLDEATDSWVLEGTDELLAAQESRQRRYSRVRDQYMEVARRQISSILPADPKPKQPSQPTPASASSPKLEDAASVRVAGLGASLKSTGFGAAAKDDGNTKLRPRKAVGIGGRRVAPPPPPLKKHF